MTPTTPIHTTLRGLTAASALMIASAAIAQESGQQTGQQGQTGTPIATATLQDAEGGRTGLVEVFDAGAGFLIRVDASGLEPGWHGFHIHETGDCGDGFAAAGSHLAPNDAPHGFFSGQAPHMGDLPNLHADAEGAVRADLQAEGVLLDAEGGLLDGDGSAFIIHAQADDYRSADSAGDRVACGVLEQAS